MAERGAPTTEIGHGGGLSWTTGTPYDPGEYTPELQWPLSVHVYDKMRRQDAQVKSVLRAVSLPVRRARWYIEPNGAPDAAVQLISEDLGLPVLDGAAPVRSRQRRGLQFDDHVRQALNMLAYGHMPFEIAGEIRDDGLWHLTRLGERMPSTLSKINTGRSGELESIEQYPSGLPGDLGPVLTIPAQRLVMYTHERDGGLWQGQSVLRSAYKHWLLKDRLIRVDAIKHERNGMGIPTVEMAEGSGASQIAEANIIASKIRAGEQVGGAMPYGSRLRMVGVEGSLPDTLSSIRYHDEQISQEMLAMFMQLGKTRTGSRALGDTLVDFFVMTLTTLADDLACTFNEMMVERWVDWNWGEDTPAPLVCPSDIGADHTVTAESIAALVQFGALTADDTLEEWLRANYRIPAKPANAVDNNAPATPTTGRGYPAVAASRVGHRRDAWPYGPRT